MKKYILLAVACLAGIQTFSQSLMHAVGLSTYVDHTSGMGSIVSVAFTYSPRFNLMETPKMSVSVGIPLSVGGSGGGGGSSSDGYYIGDDYYYYDDNDYTGPQTKGRWMVDVPVIINLNYGGLSSKINQNKFGFFVGGGFGYHYGPVNLKHTDRNGYHYTDSTSQSSYGPVGNVGLRIKLSKRTHEGIDIKLSYMKSVSKKQPDIYGLTVMYAF